MPKRGTWPFCWFFFVAFYVHFGVICGVFVYCCARLLGVKDDWCGVLGSGSLFLYSFVLFQHQVIVNIMFTKAHHCKSKEKHVDGHDVESPLPGELVDDNGG